MKKYITIVGIFCMIMSLAVQAPAQENEAATGGAVVWGVTYDRCSHFFTVIQGEIETVEDGYLIINWLSLYRGEKECTSTEIPYDRISESQKEAWGEAERLNGNPAPGNTI